jgi:two-component system phosphate regulon sensor histidine kinase PhoR
MKKHLLLIVLLMSLCVAGILGLQLFWNYQNYKTTVKAFDHDINEALITAVTKETVQRQDRIVNRFKNWLADTSLIIITADRKNRDSTTVFYTQDAHPKFKEDLNRKSQFGIHDFKEKLDHITPKAKAYMIEHFGDRILKRDLEQGTVYYYTQMLGDSLQKVFNNSKMDSQAMKILLRHELATKNIDARFVLNPKQKADLFLTRKVNTDLRKPYKNDFVYAGFENPYSYFFRKIKWVIISSLLLIFITIGCFVYTLKILFSQHKLAQLKEAFISNMTHELNTPISSIKITAEALKSFKHRPETTFEYLDIITYQADKLSELTSQILNNSQLIKNDTVDWTNINLNELVATAIHDLKSQIDSNCAMIEYRLPKVAPCIYGHNSSLRNALINLIDNALKYASATPRITIDVIVSAKHAVVNVTDNGIGIPEEYHQEVFEQFFRVPQGNLHDVKGFGLGLSYVRQVIKRHKGEVAVISNVPSGSIFTIKLPLS